MALFNWLKYKKPEYYWKARALFRYKNSKQSTNLVSTCFGSSLRVPASDIMSKAIRKTGVHELVVAESLWRLTNPGDLVVDVGANMGFFTQLLSAAVGINGEVHAFEPNPEMLPILTDNRVRAAFPENIYLHEMALSDKPGIGMMELPGGYNQNSGLARLAEKVDAPSAESNQVLVSTLDDIFFRQNRIINVLKIDVEGAEIKVLTGASQLLENQRIRAIIYEDFETYPSSVASLLLRYHFTVFKLGKGWLGPKLYPASVAGKKVAWESVNYVAVTDAPWLKKKLEPMGYYCLEMP